jgi:hypothetical protein
LTAEDDEHPADLLVEQPAGAEAEHGELPADLLFGQPTATEAEAKAEGGAQDACDAAVEALSEGSAASGTASLLEQEPEACTEQEAADNCGVGGSLPAEGSAMQAVTPADEAFAARPKLAMSPAVSSGGERAASPAQPAGVNTPEMPAEVQPVEGTQQPEVADGSALGAAAEQPPESPTALRRAAQQSYSGAQPHGPDDAPGSALTFNTNPLAAAATTPGVISAGGCLAHSPMLR